MTVLIPFAEKNETGKTVSIHEVSNGLQCGCVCLSCGSAVIANQGKKNAWHFSHADSEQAKMCDISFGRSVFKMLLQEASRYTHFMPPKQFRPSSEPLQIDEVTVKKDQPADILLRCGEQYFAIYLSYYGRRFDYKKSRDLSGSTVLIEIDLDEYRPELSEIRTTSPVLILERLFCQNTRGKILHSRSQDEPNVPREIRHYSQNDRSHRVRCLSCDRVWDGHGGPQTCKYCGSPMVSRKLKTANNRF